MGLVVTCGLVGKKKLGYKIDFCAKNEVKPREIQILPVLKPRHILASGALRKVLKTFLYS